MAAATPNGSHPSSPQLTEYVDVPAVRRVDEALREAVEGDDPRHLQPDGDGDHERAPHADRAEHALHLVGELRLLVRVRAVARARRTEREVARVEAAPRDAHDAGDEDDCRQRDAVGATRSHARSHMPHAATREADRKAVWGRIALESSVGVRGATGERTARHVDEEVDGDGERGAQDVRVHKPLGGAGGALCKVEQIGRVLAVVVGEVVAVDGALGQGGAAEDTVLQRRRRRAK
eukprot:2377659-Prymnesium_polylepis.1